MPTSRKGKVVAPSITLGDDEGNNKGTANASISKCTGQFTHGVSERTGGVKNVFYNRVFDGETLSYVWGSCTHTCVNADQPHRTLVPAGCDVPQLFAVKAKMSVTGNSMMRKSCSRMKSKTMLEISDRWYCQCPTKRRGY